MLTTPRTTLLGLLAMLTAAGAFAQDEVPSWDQGDTSVVDDLASTYLEERAFVDAFAPPVIPPLIGWDAEYEDLGGAELERPPHDALAYAPPSAEDPWSFDVDAINQLPFDLDTFEHQRLLEFLEYYATEGRDRYTGWLARSGRYQAMIMREAERIGAPPELFWIAAIESGFHNDAVSHAGAVGMWQFMSRTARGRGMRVDSWVDERRDPELATRYALEYLQYQYERFGTWGLAFAAYNAGSGHVRGELRTYGVNDFWALDDYDAVYNNARRYGTRAIALALMWMNPEAFGLDGVVLDEPWTYDEVELPGGTRLAAVARDADVELDVLRDYNPALLRDRIPTDLESWPVRLPEGSLNHFVERWDDFNPDEVSDYEIAELRFGESVEALAVRYGLPERVIRRANDLSSRDAVAYGTPLRIPVDGRDAEAPGDPVPPEVVILPAQRFSYPGRVRVFYDVNARDTAAAIAEHFDVSLFELCDWNDLDPDAILWSGMTLQVWVDDGFDLSHSHVRTDDEVRAIEAGSEAWDAYLAEQQTEQRSRRRRYTVRPGDSVRRIARRFDVSEADIIRWNRLGDDAMIIIGQELVIGR